MMGVASRPAWAGRLARLQQECVARELGAIVVTNSVNILYLCGFRGSSGTLLVAPDSATLFTDGRYQQAVREAIGRGELGPVGFERVERGYDPALAMFLHKWGGLHCGFEAAHVSVATFDTWRRLLPAVEWHPTVGVVEAFRAVKDVDEICCLRAGARALSNVAGKLRDFVAIGRTEREIASTIDRELEAAGFSGPAFPTIVASGPHSALPHARPTDRRVASGDLVLLDFGGVLDGYCVDLTRMVAVGQVAPALVAVFDAVHEAQAAAIAAVKAGVAASEIDCAARGALEARGYGEAFLHSTGHGLGLEVHEAPRIARAPAAEDAESLHDSASRVEVLAAGMVCTIEPGAYLEGLGGVRLEDDVLVTAEGCEVLTTAPRGLEVV